MQTCLLKVFLLVLFLASCSWKCFLKAGLMNLGFGIAEHMVGCKVPSLGNHRHCHSWLSTMCVSQVQVQKVLACFFSLNLGTSTMSKLVLLTNKPNNNNSSRNNKKTTATAKGFNNNKGVATCGKEQPS